MWFIYHTAHWLAVCSSVFSIIQSWVVITVDNFSMSSFSQKKPDVHCQLLRSFPPLTSSSRWSFFLIWLTGFIGTRHFTCCNAQFLWLVPWLNMFPRFNHCRTCIILFPLILESFHCINIQIFHCINVCWLIFQLINI